jgi:hypothetical protein
MTGSSLTLVETHEREVKALILIMQDLQVETARYADLPQVSVNDTTYLITLGSYFFYGPLYTIKEFVKG